MKYAFALSIVALLLLAGCAQEAPQEPQEPQAPEQPEEPEEPQAPEEPICVDMCGDGVCQEVVCMGEGCPCPETPESCPEDCAEEPMPGSDRDEHGCIPSAGYVWCEPKQKCLRPWEEPCVEHLDEAQAREIATNSECMTVGPLKGPGTYNNNTYTWWFDLVTQKPGCAPACVVHEANETAEVNWRCTGLITE